MMRARIAAAVNVAWLVAIVVACWLDSTRVQIGLLSVLALEATLELKAIRATRSDTTCAFHSSIQAAADERPQAVH